MFTSTLIGSGEPRSTLKDLHEARQHAAKRNDACAIINGQCHFLLRALSSAIGISLVIEPWSLIIFRRAFALRNTHFHRRLRVLLLLGLPAVVINIHFEIPRASRSAEAEPPVAFTAVEAAFHFRALILEVSQRFQPY